MNLRSLGLLVLILTVLPAYGQTDTAREFKQLEEQRDKALAAAAEPINRRYLDALEQLQRKATQANDLETALKIKASIAAVKNQTGGAPPTADLDYIGEWMLTAVGSGYKEKRILNPDGTTTSEIGADGKWRVMGQKLKLFKKDGGIDEFDLPPRDGLLNGRNQKNYPLTLKRVK